MVPRTGTKPPFYTIANQIFTQIFQCIGTLAEHTLKPCKLKILKNTCCETFVN